MKLHFENALTLIFFIVSLIVLAPACSNVSEVLTQSSAVGTTDHAIEINPR